MKTILAPTDFSKISLNAIDYAVEIAKLSNAKLVLLHVYNVPVITSDAPAIIPNMDETEKDCLDGLKQITRDIQLKYDNKLTIECICKCGFPVDEINLYAEENKVDLIVMGMEGTGYLSEKLIGSTTTSLIKKAKCPVLAIDRNVKFKSIKKIALAWDYSKTGNESFLTPLKEIAHLFKSHVYVLNVVRELETIPAVSDAIEGIKLKHSLEDVIHSFHHTENESVVEGINDFVDDKKIDLVVMIPRMHNILDNLFHESNTKHLAFHTKVPLLALHE